MNEKITPESPMSPAGPAAELVQGGFHARVWAGDPEDEEGRFEVEVYRESPGAWKVNLVYKGTLQGAKGYMQGAVDVLSRLMEWTQMGKRLPFGLGEEWRKE